MKRIAIAIVTVAMGGALALGALAAPVSVREARFAAQGYETPTATPGPSPTPTRTPTPTATPIPFALTPRPTSTSLVPRPATPTPQMVSATPGPCTIALGERSATCKTAYYQTVTWTLRVTTTIADQRVVTSSLFDFTSRAVFTPSLAGGSIITVAPRWQLARGITVITLTGSISGGNWVTGTTLTGQAPAGSVVTLVHHRWHTPTASYRASFYSVTSDSAGRWTLSPAGGIIMHKRDYWQVRHVASGVTHVAGVLTRRVYFPIARR